MLAQDTLLQDRYRIIRLLGQGGMGAVYLAFDERLNQYIALKENTGGDARQFQHEAQLLARLRHPNLPRVIDHFFEPNGPQYLVMDYIEGEDLETLREQQGALPETQVRAWLDQILDAVAYLHAQNVIHRDIKPENIKITPNGQAMLVDFGIAKIYQAGFLTRSSQKMGTHGYASPLCRPPNSSLR
jgi:serine/threonine-protein kinase